MGHISYTMYPIDTCMVDAANSHTIRTTLRPIVDTVMRMVQWSEASYLALSNSETKIEKGNSDVVFRVF